MSITVLNNISSLIAENAVSNTQASLQNTLQELSTGLKINSGSDDPAGLSFADGLGANISALNESSQNATNGIGLLQTADGALSQVTTILNQAVQIATEASNGGLTTSQSTALSTEFNAILDEINQIGSTTNFNGTSVFGGDSTFVSSNTTGTTAAAAAGTSDITAATQLTDGATYTITDTSNPDVNFSFTAGADSTVGSLQTAITSAASSGSLPAGTALSIGADGTVTISGLSSTASVAETGGADILGGFGDSGATVLQPQASATTGLTDSAALTAGQTFNITDGASSFSYTAAAGDTVQTLITALGTASNWGGAVPAGVTASTATGSLVINGLQSGATISGTSTAAPTSLATFAPGASTATETGSSAVTDATALTTGQTFTITDGASSFSYTAAAGDTVQTLVTALGTASNWGGEVPAGVTASDSTGALVINGLSPTATIGGTSSAVVGTFTAGTAIAAQTGSATGLTASTALTAGQEFKITDGTNTFSYTAAAGDTVQSLVTALSTAANWTGGVPSGVTASAATGSLVINGLQADASFAGTTLAAAGGTLGAFSSDGSATTVFTAGATTAATPATPGASAPMSANTLLTAGSVTTITDASTAATGSQPFTFTAAAGDTIGDLQDAITAAVAAGTLSTGTALTINAENQVQITAGSSSDVLQVSTNDQTLGTFSGNSGSAVNTASVFTSDGTISGAFDLNTSVSNLSAGSLGLNNLSLNSAADAQSALTAISSAIDSVAGLRGSIGASVNTLTSFSSVETTEVQNLTSAQNNVQNADIASTTSNLTQYNILEQTGFDALSQSQTAEQNVLKLLQQ